MVSDFSDPSLLSQALQTTKAQRLDSDGAADGDAVADDLYQYRKGASQYFGGGTATVSEEAAPKTKKKVVKRKKKEVSGGCG